MCGDLQGGAETLQLSLSLPLLSGHQPGGGGGGGNVGGGGGVGDVGGGDVGDGDDGGVMVAVVMVM